MFPRIAISTSCVPSTDWGFDVACGPLGDCALDIRLDEDTLHRADEVAHYALRRSRSDVELRYHFPVGRYEISTLDADEAADTMEAYRNAIDGIARANGRFLTAHSSLLSDDPLTRRRVATERLSEIVAYGAEKGVIVCLENLRWGQTSDPEVFMNLVEDTGASVTFDIGHANSSDFAAQGFTAEKFIELIGPSIMNAHVYDREDPHHIAPDNLDRIGPTLRALLEHAPHCDWWVIELFHRDDVTRTRDLLLDFRDAQRSR